MKHKKSFQPYDPKRCWVGDTHKVCYDTEEDALLVAGSLEYQNPGCQLTAYKCEYGNHWHIASRKPSHHPHYCRSRSH